MVKIPFLIVVRICVLSYKNFIFCVIYCLLRVCADAMRHNASLDYTFSINKISC